MSIMSPVTETARGFHAFIRGFKWLRSHPKYLFMLFVPMAIGFLGLIEGMNLFTTYADTIMSAALFAKPDVWYMLGLYYASYALLYVAAIVTTIISAILVTNVIASPFYEVVSVAIEREMTGAKGEDLTFMQNFKVMFVELKKVVFILTITVATLFIPMVNVIATIVAAFLVGWDFFDYPMARRDWSFRRRLGFVLSNFWSVTGFGLWLVIPFVNFIFMPLAVAGGTILNLEALEKRELVTTLLRAQKEKHNERQ